MDERSRITAWLEPNSKTVCAGCGRSESKYGNITNDEWLEREKNRINETGHTCCIVKSIDGSKALFYIDGFFDNGLWIDVRQENSKLLNVV